MSFDAFLATRALESGRAVRSATMRHRAIADDPLAVIAWELGAEPYVIGSIALGRRGHAPHVFVPGLPLDRDLLFAALTPFAQEFCAAFEAGAASPCETIEHMGNDLELPLRLPQIVVPNEQTVKLLGRLGRRLAYLSTEGDRPADPILVRLGRHLMWLASYARTPGQQLLMPVTELLRTHYGTAMSDYEAGSLAALDAWVEPPEGNDGFHAATAAEDLAVGPVPDPRDGDRVHHLMGDLARQCGAMRTAAKVARYGGALRRLYSDLTVRTATLLWRALDRERRLGPAPSVARREREDRIEYARHIAWMNGASMGRRKARMSASGAIRSLRQLEAAQVRLEAEEAIDDPLRMIPHVLAGKAFGGRVVSCNPDRRELIGGRRNLRPSVTLLTDEPCLLPVGSELWWTSAADKAAWLLTRADPCGAGSEVELVLQTNRSLPAGLPRFGARVRFTQLGIPDAYEARLPHRAPWSHRAPEPAADDLEETDDTQARAA